MNETLKNLLEQYKQKISSAESLKELDELFLALFGKNGEITLLPKGFKDLPKEELRVVAPLFNQVKSQLESEISKKRQAIRDKSYEDLKSEKLDLEIASSQAPRNDGNRLAHPVRNDGIRKGQLHPLTAFQNEIKDLFGKIGFQVYEAPHIDTDYYNFEVLNIPEEHPARDLWDTLYIDIDSRLRGNDGEDKSDDSQNKLLLRTHTSNAQVRVMKEVKPPMRAMVLDWCFRYENLDARHEHTFDQFEVVWVEKGLNMGHLQYLSEYFFKAVLGEDTQVRLRPKYYPFVEPGAGVDATCLFCKGKGCKICGGVGWFELAGAGMIHPTVLKNGGVDPEEYSGIAWGVGLGRMLMLKYGIDDVRLFKSGDLKFLQSFKKGERGYPERSEGSLNSFEDK